MAKSDRDIISAPFTVTNSEVVNSLDADTATLTAVSNSLAAIIKTLIDQGIMSGSVS